MIMTLDKNCGHCRDHLVICSQLNLYLHLYMEIEMFCLPFIPGQRNDVFINLNKIITPI